ncbi:hypothetical protein DKT77_00850 [Meridianimarinicoccus roseus]|uniref:Capsule polysaccharide biosynthesis protein n=1 Tax=Meridianimarinicoccus roseus TaxID=2072018 RepID=A0A2V2LFX5_9RHOB|nr:hypothetical protein [Meridianimarinicoccus roseus]PWR04548.1 hypothetical protein DKT77_00850 [Meridianimarinicoccus roseus]
MSDDRKGTVLIYSIHRTEPWFRHLGQNMGFDRSFTVSDLPGEGDFCVVDDFKAHQAAFYRASATASDLLDEDDLAEIRARCRVLRFLSVRRAAAMTLAMAEAFQSVLDRTRPDVIVSFPIDRYVSDVLSIIARRRGIPFYELTVSAIPDMSMLMQKGVLCRHGPEPDPAEVDRHVQALATPLFTPSYVQGVANFNQLRFLKVFGYFRLRGFVFWLISLWKGDRLNLHYLDAQSFLGHKPTLSDRVITRMVDYGWREKIDAFPKKRRVLFGLQLFPEASIDYWIHDLELIEHEDLVVEAAEAFSAAGYTVLVKDHPLQFGFRQTGLIRRLLALPNVVFLPYEVSGMEALSLCGVNFTCTGTLGLQAALAGAKSVTTRNYYTTDDDFILLENRAQVPRLPELVEAFPEVEDLPSRQRRIVANLLRGSFPCDFFSFKGFDPSNPSEGATALGRILGREVASLKEIKAATLKQRLDDAG